jgi:hypothetical protein
MHLLILESIAHSNSNLEVIQTVVLYIAPDLVYFEPIHVFVEFPGPLYSIANSGIE